MAKIVSGERWEQLKAESADRVDDSESVQAYWAEFAKENGISQRTGRPVTAAEIDKSETGHEATRARLEEAMGEYGTVVTVQQHNDRLRHIE